MRIKILALEDGQIAERGSHEVLLAQNGVYTRLHEMQFREAPSPQPPRRHPPGRRAGGEGRPPFRGQFNLEDDLV